MTRIGSVGDAVAHLAPVFEGLRRERLVVLCLSRSMRLRRRFEVPGDEVSAPLPFGRVLRAVAATNAAFVVIAHNHPGGGCCPSHADAGVTRDLDLLCRAMGARLLDHLIFGEDGFTSFWQRKLL